MKKATTIELVERILRMSKESPTVKKLMQMTNRSRSIVRQSLDLLMCEGKVAVDDTQTNQFGVKSYKHEKAIRD